MSIVQDDFPELRPPGHRHAIGGWIRFRVTDAPDGRLTVERDFMDGDLSFRDGATIGPGDTFWGLRYDVLGANPRGRWIAQSTLERRQLQAGGPAIPDSVRYAYTRPERVPGDDTAAGRGAPTFPIPYRDRVRVTDAPGGRLAVTRERLTGDLCAVSEGDVGPGELFDGIAFDVLARMCRRCWVVLADRDGHPVP